MNDIKTSNAAAFEALPRGAVAVFVGGTSGIGQAMFELFVRSTTGKAVTAIVVGRNQKAAEESFAALRAESKEENDLPTLKFISCDVTLMKNVRKATKEILDSHSKIHILVVSQGYLTLDSRTPTEEGLDRKLAVDYYSRWVFIHELIPALEKARSEGEKATVTSVLGLGKPGKGPIDPDDFGVEKNYGVARIAVTVSSYQNYMLQVSGSFSVILVIISWFLGICTALSGDRLYPCIPWRRPHSHHTKVQLDAFVGSSTPDPSFDHLYLCFRRDVRRVHVARIFN